MAVALEVRRRVIARNPETDEKIYDTVFTPEPVKPTTAEQFLELRVAYLCGWDWSPQNQVAIAVARAAITGTPAKMTAAVKAAGEALDEAAKEMSGRYRTVVAGRGRDRVAVIAGYLRWQALTVLEWWRTKAPAEYPPAEAPLRQAVAAWKAAYGDEQPSQRLW